MSRIASALLGGVALVAVGAAPSLAQSPFDGAYVGAFTGYTDNNASATSGAARADIDRDGWLYGAYAGYGQTFDKFYFGGEAEIGTASLSGNSGTVAGLPTKLNTNESWGLSARAGYLLTDTTLLYARAGWQRTNYDVTVGTGANRIKVSDNLDGYRLGGGLEYAVTDNVLVRTEYNYVNYDNTNFRENQVRVGVAYRF
ncbi:outer membrane beta-barrel protein [Niveispirillum sp.]|uniref:outer membrane protein n=1 Tax=Niveispirillum sp. TaxID=1917217 RepID=UPI001B415F62|nr:outer membrane beta-barrel protein [Niveispirillum sp.]MBP7335568.1 porin family protein [Niveispirillum sp.]